MIQKGQEDTFLNEWSWRVIQKGQEDAFLNEWKMAGDSKKRKVPRENDFWRRGLIQINRKLYI